MNVNSLAAQALHYYIRKMAKGTCDRRNDINSDNRREDICKLFPNWNHTPLLIYFQRPTESYRFSDKTCPSPHVAVAVGITLKWRGNLSSIFWRRSADWNLRAGLRWSRWKVWIRDNFYISFLGSQVWHSTLNELHGLKSASFPNEIAI